MPYTSSAEPPAVVLLLLQMASKAGKAVLPRAAKRPQAEDSFSFSLSPSKSDRPPHHSHGSFTASSEPSSYQPLGNFRKECPQLESCEQVSSSSLQVRPAEQDDALMQSIKQLKACSNPKHSGSADSVAFNASPPGKADTSQSWALQLSSMHAGPEGSQQAACGIAAAQLSKLSLAGSISQPEPKLQRDAEQKAASGQRNAANSQGHSHSLRSSGTEEGSSQHTGGGAIAEGLQVKSRPRAASSRIATLASSGAAENSVHSKAAKQADRAPEGKPSSAERAKLSAEESKGKHSAHANSAISSSATEGSAPGKGRASMDSGLLSGPVFVPIVLTMDDTDHKLLVEEWLLRQAVSALPGLSLMGWNVESRHGSKAVHAASAAVPSSATYPATFSPVHW